MRLHVRSGVLRIVGNTVFFFGACLSVFGLLLAWAFHDARATIGCLWACLCIGVAKVLTELLALLMDTYGKCVIVFGEGGVVYRNNPFAASDISLRYFRFQWSFLETDLVLPKLLVTFPDASRVTVYVTRKQIGRVRAMLPNALVEV